MKNWTVGGEAGLRKATNVIYALLPVNCYYNSYPDENGICYSTTCMVAQCVDTATLGCELWSKEPSIVAFYEDEAKRRMK